MTKHDSETVLFNPKVLETKSFMFWLYTIKVISLSFRPKLKMENMLANFKLLWDYFHTNTGVRRDLKRPWRCHRQRITSAGG